MFRDDRLEYNVKNRTLQVKMPEIPTARPATVKNDRKSQKPKLRRTTKFNFSGTNYETCTLGHVACLEAMLEEDPELIEDICRQARDIADVRKLLRDHDNNKFAALQSNPDFLARASLFKKGFKKEKKTNRMEASHKDADNHDFDGKELEGNKHNYHNHGYKNIYGDKETVDDKFEADQADQVNCQDENHHGNEDIGDEDVDNSLNANYASDLDIYVSSPNGDSEVDLDGNSDTEGENGNYGSQVDSKSDTANECNE